MADGDGATTQAEEAGDKPQSTAQSTTWVVGGFAVASGLVVSAVVHMVLVGTVLLVSPRLFYPTPANSVTVDLVTPDEIAAMSSNKDEATKPEQPAPETPSRPTQPMAPQQPAQLPQAQLPQAPLSQPPPLDAFALPGAPSQVAPSAPAQPIGEAERLARLLGMPTPVAGLTGGGPSEYKANLTPEEIAAFTTHVQSCWIAPAGVSSTSLKVVIRVSLRADGKFMGEPALIAAPASAQGPALVQSAMKALQRCLPYTDLPAAKYDEWRLLDLQFSAGGMTTASPVPNAQRTSPPG